MFSCSEGYTYECRINEVIIRSALTFLISNYFYVSLSLQRERERDVEGRSERENFTYIKLLPGYARNTVWIRLCAQDAIRHPTRITPCALISLKIFYFTVRVDSSDICGSLFPCIYRARVVHYTECIVTDRKRRMAFQ